MDISQLKSIGNMQNTYMFRVNIPVFPLGIGINQLEFLCRTTTIPTKSRSGNNIRFLGKQYNLPGAEKIDSSGKGGGGGNVTSWGVTVLMDETHQLYDQLVKWHNAITVSSTGVSVQQIKTDAFVQLLGIDKDVVTKRFKILGIYLTGIPSLGDLNQNNTEGHITFDVEFAFDDIDFDENNALTF